MDKLIKKIIWSYLLLMSLLGVSCKSVPKKVNKQGFLTAMIVDENNNPVEGYVVKLCVDGVYSEIDETDSNGIVYLSFFNGKNIGFYGKKEGFTKVETDDLKNFDSNKVFCWKVYSEDFVLTEVEKCIEKKDYKQAYKKLCLLEPSEYKETNYLYSKLKNRLGKF